MNDQTATPVGRVKRELALFYKANPQIKSSHGLSHVLAVHRHAERACLEADPPLSDGQHAEVEIAALLHDVDDRKYFPLAKKTEDVEIRYANAAKICSDADLPSNISLRRILQMISWASCSENGNNVPLEVSESDAYHLLIPRWADRLEAVGAIGVVRCYRYNQEKGAPLCSPSSPRAATAEDVFRLAKQERFDAYLHSGGRSDDMISHYYDKLLHVARPPPEIVRNSYLERMAEDGSKELVEVCVRFGRTGLVDEEYILGLEKNLEPLDPSLLGDLPPGVFPSILAKFCDTPSLAVLLVAVTSSASRREAFLNDFASGFSMRIDMLEKSGAFPATKGNARWNRQTMKIADELRKFCAVETGSSGSDDDANSVTWCNFLSRLKDLTLVLPPLRLFWDELKTGRGKKLRPVYNDMENCNRFELPIFFGNMGTFVYQLGGRAEFGVNPYVVVSLPHSTWQPILLSEWGKLHNSQRLPFLRPRPRRATPLPPLARIRMDKLVPTHINSLPPIFRVSAKLTATDEVIELDVPNGSKILIFSRVQACERMKASSIWQYHLKQHRDIVDEETWPLAYAYGGGDEDDLPLTQVIKDPFAETLEYLNGFDPERDRELFAFIEPTDESNNEAGGDQAVEMSHNIQSLLRSMGAYP